ncbi:hypothetical protein [Dictyobacter aurantiacus]|uniref:Uncharacterized protein n=1 Tax=Dictyobacter aurantiacus TaxID=1936993 RepID=A0A401ZFM2_9CHLR|nr:hypothetical protein [Dictyobacter aurantiacus]GCE05690.1 hypothetical protein KDAU_30190 [Dictyobacter aurantiacus]
MLIKQSIMQNLTRVFVIGGMAATMGLTFLQAPVAQAATTKCAANDTRCVITFGDQQIQTRQNDLNTLNTKIQTILGKKQITDAQANDLSTDVKNHLSIMSTLKTRLDAAPNAEEAREDVKSIYQHRILAVVLPRDYRILHLDVEIGVRDKLVDLKPTLENAIDKASDAQKAKLNPLFTDYKSDLTKIEGVIDNAQSTLPKLTAVAYNTDRDEYKANDTTLKQDERTIHSNLVSAAKDLHQIRQILDPQ